MSSALLASPEGADRGQGPVDSRQSWGLLRREGEADPEGDREKSGEEKQKPQTLLVHGENHYTHPAEQKTELRPEESGTKAGSLSNGVLIKYGSEGSGCSERGAEEAGQGQPAGPGWECGLSPGVAPVQAGLADHDRDNQCDKQRQINLRRSALTRRSLADGVFVRGDRCLLELFLFGGAGQSRDERFSAGDHLGDVIEVSCTDKSLVLDGPV
jgi:hypothetical protein